MIKRQDWSEKEAGKRMNTENKIADNMTAGSVKKEIRQALLGDLVLTDNKLVVSGIRMAKFRYGLQDGIGSVFFLGVMCRRRWYMTKKSRKQIRELAVKAMQDMGRMVGLKSCPDGEAVYCAYLLNNPAILTFTQGRDGIIEMTAYSGRGISGLIATFRTLNRFQKAMQGVLERMSEAGEQKKLNALQEQEKKERLDQKQAKRDRKQAKERAKQIKRQVGKQQAGIQQVGQKNPPQIQQDSFQIQRKTGALAQKLTGKLGRKSRPESLSVQERLAAGQAELEEAKLAAEEAAMKLAVAEARLAAQEAEAKLEALQEKLAAEPEQEKKQMRDK